MADYTVDIKLPLTGGFPKFMTQKSAGEWGTQVESLGYDTIWMSESWGVDPYVYLSQIASETTEIGLGTAVTNAFSRSPGVLAMGGWSLAEISDERAILGVGASHPGFVEGLHGLEYDRPIRRVHETIELVKLYTSSDADTVEYNGQIFDVSGYEPIETHLPVYNAALGPANLRATGRVADGWIPHLLPYSQFEWAFDIITESARERGRSGEDITVVPQVLSAVSEDGDRGKYHLSSFIAEYIGEFDMYKNVSEKTFPDETAEIASAWRSGDHETAISNVTEEMRRDFGVAGTPEEARDQLRELSTHPVIDRPMVYVPWDVAPDDTELTITSLSPDRL